MMADDVPLHRPGRAGLHHGVLGLAGHHPSAQDPAAAQLVVPGGRHSPEPAWTSMMDDNIMMTDDDMKMT